MDAQTHLTLHQLRTAEATRHPRHRLARRARPPGRLRRGAAAMLVRAAASLAGEPVRPTVRTH